MTLFDRIPASLRHTIIAIAAGLGVKYLPVVEANYTSWHLPVVVTAGLGTLWPIAFLYLTKVSRQYGFGSLTDPQALIDSVDSLPDAVPAVDPTVDVTVGDVPPVETAPAADATALGA